ncbi:MAG: hypothetical protein HQ591_04130 [candidate division Zixibacteria bacterium]|nr:hypothetical protein [Candidatus Tariuqbacter arcticus]
MRPILSLLTSIILVFSALQAGIPDENDQQFKAFEDSLKSLIQAGNYELATKIYCSRLMEDSANFDQLYNLNFGPESPEEGYKYLMKVLELYPDFIGTEAGLIYCCFELNDLKCMKKHLIALHDKSGMGDFIEEYNRNMLATVEPDAIIFTNGDNDTTPALYWQYIHGFRKDVSIVNLSMLNKPGYIKRFKHNDPQVPMSFSDEYIDEHLDPVDTTTIGERYLPEGKKWVSIETPEGAYEWEIPATKHYDSLGSDASEKNALRVQDIMVMDIMRTNQGKRPIYFAITCSNVNLMGLKDYLTMDGFAFRLLPEKRGAIDPEKLRINLFEKFKYNACINFNSVTHCTREPWYRGPLYPMIKGEKKLAQNYRSAFLQLAYYYYQQDEAGIEPKPNTALEKQYAQFNELSSKAKMYLCLKCMGKCIPDSSIPWTNENIVIQVGRIYSDKEYFSDAVDYFKKALEMNSNLPAAHFLLGQAYISLGNEESARMEYEILKTMDADMAEKLLDIID